MDGKVIDSSLSRDPLVVELGKKTVIAGKLTNDNAFSDRFGYIGEITTAWNVFVVLIEFLSGIFSSGLEQSLLGVCEG